MIKSHTLLTGIVEEQSQERGFTVTRFNPSGEPAASALVGIVAANYHRVTDRPEVGDLARHVGDKVTVVRTATGMIGSPSIIAVEGKLVEIADGYGILPKGARTRGFRVPEDVVLDVLDGFCVPAAQALVDKVKDSYPPLVNLTQEHLDALPGEGKGDGKCRLALIGERRMPDCVSPDALWLISEYWPEDDICDRAVLLIRRQHGFSETGSEYGQNLLRGRLGVIENFNPLDWPDAVALTDADYDGVVPEVVWS